jgi:hypothetical protein
MSTALSCKVCRTEIDLDPDPALRMAQVKAFTATHRDHEEELSVELRLLEPDDAVSAAAEPGPALPRR